MTCPAPPATRPAPRMIGDPLATPHRVAFAGDWHADLSWAVTAVWAAHDRHADVIVHLGDFGYQFGKPFLNGLTAALAAADIPLLFVDGNHEDHPWLNRQRLAPNGLRKITDWIWHLPRGYRWEWDGLRFLALGGAHSVDGTWRRRNRIMWHPEERITPEQADQVIAGGPTDIMVSHDCPAGVDIPGLNNHLFPGEELLRAGEHRVLLRRVVDQVRPAAVWHGHYHVHYRQRAQFGYGSVHVTGLDMNGTSLKANLDIVDLDTLQHLAGRA